MFAPLPDKPDHDALEQPILDRWADQGDLRAAAGQERRRPPVQLHRRARHGQQVPRRAHRVGPHAQGRVPALQGAARASTSATRTASTARASGSRSASRRSSASTPSGRSRSTAWPSSPGAAGPSSSVSSADAHQGLDPPRPVDGLGARLLHLLRHQHRVHLAVPARIVHERGWLYRGHRATEWCPRCGTSISRPRAGRQLRRPRGPVAVGPLPAARPAGRGHRHLDHHAVDAAGQRRRRGVAHRRATAAAPTATGWPSSAPAWRTRPSTRSSRGAELVGWRYEGPFDDLGPGGAVEHRVIAWDEVSLDEGTGIVHIAPGCGTEDFELSKVEDLPVLTPVDESGRFYADYGWLAGAGRHDAADDIIADLRKRDLLVDAGTITHRYPECWRCHTPLIFRISDDWFIGGRRDPRSRCATPTRTVEWTPEYMGKRMDDWLVNMSDWNISRRRYYGLPLPFYPCSLRPPHRDRVQGGAGRARHRQPLDGLEELRRPVDRRRRASAARSAATWSRRITEVGDVWLDAGIVPFSTLGWENPEWLDEGYATGAAEGLTTADLPDHAYWEEWFPGRLGVGDARADPAVVLLAAVHVGRAHRAGAVPQGARLREDARRDRPGDARLVGQHDRRRGRLRPHGRRRDALAVLRPAAEPEPAVRLRARPARSSASCSRSGTAPRSSSSTPTSPASPRRSPTSPTRPGDADLTDLDRWIVARTRQLVAEATEAYEQYLTVNVLRAFEAFVDDLSNWYVRRSRRRFWDGDDAALRTLWSLARRRRCASSRRSCRSSPSTSGSASWPTSCPDARPSLGLPGRLAARSSRPTTELLGDVAAVRQVVELGRQARAKRRS